jgi:Cu/Ag efflux protein CusF
MKKIHIAALSFCLAAVLGAPQLVMAQANSTSAASKSADFTDGEVRTVYKDEGKITIKHGEIKNLNMSAMTMVFMVSDKSLLNKIKAGDKIKFKAISKNGELVVTEIQTSK